MLADRMVLLDHLTFGRAMFGVGPGALPSDAFMLGIDPMRQREMMDESLETILALFTSEEPITRETDWFTLRDARLQLRPYSRPHMEMAVAATTSARWATPSTPAASPSSARRATPRRRSRAWRTSRAASAPTCSWRTSGPTARRHSAPTSSSRAT